MKRSSFRDLVVWQKAMDISISVYSCTQKFPHTEQFGLSSQMRRAAVSIASNIAEGTGRQGPREFAQFLSIAVGSAAELETQLEIAARLRYIDEIACRGISEQVVEVKKMLVGLRASVVR